MSNRKEIKINKLLQHAPHNAALHRERSEFQKVDKELDKLVQAIIDGVPGSHVKDRIGELEAKKEALVAKLETTEEKPVLLHTGLADLYRKQVNNLIPLLSRSEHRARAAEIIRSLIDQIVLTPVTDVNTGEKTLSVSIKGHLAGILAI